MNRHLFKKVEELKVFGYLVDIQPDLFSYFVNLKLIDLQLDNFKAFFQHGNKWMANLNNEIQVNMSNHKQVQRYFNKKFKLRFLYKQNKSLINEIYDYPDEDFCLFKHFPHSHMVVPIILPGIKIKCSCTLLWLIQYYNIYFNLNNKGEYNSGINYFYAYYDFYLADEGHIINYCHNELFNRSIADCQFEKRLSLCNGSDFNQDSTSIRFDNDTDFLYLIKWLQLVMVIILQPILSFVGIINNLITIIVIQNKHNKKHFEDKMYSHIVINCAFNIIFCFIMIFELVNQCLFYTSHVYCSAIYSTEASQYFKIVFIYFLGNLFKLCKNFSFLGFTFSRYILSLNKKKGFYKFFNGMNLKIYICILVILSTLLSVYKLFEYSVETEMDLTDEFPRDKYTEKSCEKEDFFCTFFSVMNMLNIFINDILLYFINLIIDIILVKDYSAYLINRQKLLGSSSASSNHKENEDSKIKENKVARMVVISNTFYLLTCLPEFVLSLIIIFFSKEISHYTNFNFKSSLIIDESKVFCLLSIVFNFYILIIFNRNFKKSFICLFKNLFKK